MTWGAGTWAEPAHVIPPDDHFQHVPFDDCACRPRLDSAFVSGLGGAVWYQHATIQPFPTPSALPDDWS